MTILNYKNVTFHKRREQQKRNEHKKYVITFNSIAFRKVSENKLTERHNVTKTDRGFYCTNNHLSKLRVNSVV